MAQKCLTNKNYFAIIILQNTNKRSIRTRGNTPKEIKMRKIEMIKNIGELAIAKMAVINRYVKEGKYKNNMRECPTYSELYGILQTLKCMGFDWDVEYNKIDLDEMVAIIIDGERFKV